MTASIATAQGASHAALLGLGSYRPSRVVTNAEICEHIDSTDEWIRTRSGIIERRFAEPHETVQMMSVAAARTALDRADIHPAQVDCVLVATVSHLMQTPAVAPLVSTELDYLHRELGNFATQDAVDAKVVAVRSMPWASIVLAD